ncbi:MAG: hypothetical protein ACYCSB_04755 [bacterium]
MNEKVVLNYIIKKFQLLNDDIDENQKIFSIADILRLAKDINFIRKTIQRLDKEKRQKLIDLSHLSKIERFTYSTYFNFYYKKKYEIQSGKVFNKKMTTNMIKNYLKTYYPLYKFNKNTNKMISRMRHKAYYDALLKNKRDDK